MAAIDFFDLSVGPKSLAELRCLSLELSGSADLANFCNSIVGKTPLLAELFITIDSVQMTILILLTPLFVIQRFPHACVTRYPITLSACLLLV